MKNLFFISAVLFCTMGFTQEEKKIDVKDVPAPVMSKFRAFYGDIKKVKWEKVQDNYEAEFKDTDKKRIAVTYNPEGNMIEKEWEIKKNELPKQVQDSLNKKFPGADIDELSKLDRNGLVLYEVEMDVKDKAKKEIDMQVLFTPEGKIWSQTVKKEDSEKKKDEKKEEKK